MARPCRTRGRAVGDSRVNSKNKPAPTTAEREHIDRVKLMACVCCEARGPSDVHEIVQGQWFTSCPFCPPCHTGSRGIHGDKSALKIRHKTELSCLNETIGRLMGQHYSPSRTVPAVRERVSKLTRPSKIVPRKGECD